MVCRYILRHCNVIYNSLDELAHFGADYQFVLHRRIGSEIPESIICTLPPKYLDVLLDHAFPIALKVKGALTIRQLQRNKSTFFSALIMESGEPRHSSFEQVFLLGQIRHTGDAVIVLQNMQYDVATQKMKNGPHEAILEQRDWFDLYIYHLMNKERWEREFQRHES